VVRQPSNSASATLARPFELRALNQRSWFGRGAEVEFYNRDFWLLQHQSDPATLAMAARISTVGRMSHAAREP